MIEFTPGEVSAIRWIVSRFAVSEGKDVIDVAKKCEAFRLLEKGEDGLVLFAKKLEIKKEDVDFFYQKKYRQEADDHAQSVPGLFLG